MALIMSSLIENTVFNICFIDLNIIKCMANLYGTFSIFTFFVSSSRGSYFEWQNSLNRHLDYPYYCIMYCSLRLNRKGLSK